MKLQSSTLTSMPSETPSLRFEYMEDVKRRYKDPVSYQIKKKYSRCVSTKNIKVLNAKRTILKKTRFYSLFISVLVKYSITRDTFWTQLIFWGKKKKTFHWLFISVLVNTTSILVLFLTHLVCNSTIPNKLYLLDCITFRRSGGGPFHESLWFSSQNENSPSCLVCVL